MPICEFCDQEYTTSKTKHQKTEKCLRIKKEREEEKEDEEEEIIKENETKVEVIKKVVEKNEEPEELEKEDEKREEIDVGEAITNLENNIINIKDGMKENMKQLYNTIKNEMIEIFEKQKDNTINKQLQDQIKTLTIKIEEVELENKQIKNQINQYKNEIKTEILRIKVNKPQPVLKLEYKKYESPKRTKN